MAVNLNKSDEGVGIAVQFDQDQLNQITQLINNMNQSQQTLNIIPTGHENCINTNQINFNDFTQQQQQQHQQHQQHQQQRQNSQFQIWDSTNPACQATNFFKAEPTQFQQTEMIQEVHTIMVNGQPALFIPASSAMSNNLLCQMMMSSQGQINNQFDIINQITDNHSQPNTSNNNLVQQVQNEIFWTDNTVSVGDTQNQQILCLQPDGNITFQSMPFQAQVDIPQTTSSNTVVSSPSGLENNQHKKARIQPRTPVKTPKVNTIASALANTSNIAQKKVIKKPKPSVSGFLPL